MNRLTLSFQWPVSSERTVELVRFAFALTLATYVGLTILDNIWIASVSPYLNLDTLLWWSLALGVLSVVIRRDHTPHQVLSRGTHRSQWPQLATTILIAIVLFKRVQVLSGNLVLAGLGAGLIIIVAGYVWREAADA